jgi:molecular chaperone DnaJ
MDRPRDYYLLLGVARDASPAAIRRAYRRLAERYHPDAAPAASLEDLKALQAAYETLSDAERRRRYDETLKREERESFEALSWSFVASPAAGDLRRPLQPGTVSGEILLTPSEARAGGVLPLEVPAETSCPGCRGTGGFAFDCTFCGGEGKVERRIPLSLRLPSNVRDGAVFQVKLDEPEISSVLLTVHVHPRS